MALVALVLSGCGVLDGSEIHESVLCLLALNQAGHNYCCFAPDRPQADVVDHLSGEPMDEQRNVLVESARIARGEISPLSKLNAADFDAILMPGGFGAAKNLCNYATKGVECTVLPELERVVLDFFEAKKPIGATCITPVLLAKIFEPVTRVKLTLGNSPAERENLEKMGARGELMDVCGVVSDEENRIYTTPCYMEPAAPAALFEGITSLVEKMLD